MASAALYTPEMLGLATSLAEFPWDEELPLQGAARSKSCGSTIDLALSLDDADRIERVAVRSRACAVGQAAAAIFAKAAVGRKLADMAADRERMEQWLAGNAAMPDWPGLAVIAPALDYPARHGAIMLAWQAAGDILSMAR